MRTPPLLQRVMLTLLTGKMGFRGHFEHSAADIAAGCPMPLLAPSCTSEQFLTGPRFTFAVTTRNHGCNLASCVLCKHNPAKRCTGNFAHKYWVGDKLLAKCEGSILVEVIDADTGERCMDEVQGMRIEVGAMSQGPVTLTPCVLGNRVVMS